MKQKMNNKLDHLIFIRRFFSKEAKREMLIFFSSIISRLDKKGPVNYEFCIWRFYEHFISKISNRQNFMVGTWMESSSFQVINWTFILILIPVQIAQWAKSFHTRGNNGFPSLFTTRSDSHKLRIFFHFF